MLVRILILWTMLVCNKMGKRLLLLSCKPLFGYGQMFIRKCRKVGSAEYKIKLVAKRMPLQKLSNLQPELGPFLET